MAKKILYLLIGGFVFFLFVLFSYLVHKDLFTRFDFNTTVRLQDHISRRFDEFFSFFSFIGSFEIASIFLLVLIILKRKLISFLILFFYAGFHFFELFGKTFVDHLPPPQFLLRTEKLTDFPQFYIRSEFSYPSGHAGRASFISVVIFLFLMRSKKLSLIPKLIIFSLVLIYDLTMFTSRVYLGEHWISDIIGGSLLGASLAFISAIFI